MRVRGRNLAIGLAVLPFLVVFIAWTGFFNVAASTGHWKVTEWFLHFAMRSSIRTSALWVDVPNRLPREGLQPAAGHFARGCAICHGAPGKPRSAAALAMLPQPPDLAGVVETWKDGELFRIIKHGVRYTGMPAWPTQARDDEVWAMVAFLRHLPSMEPVTYRALVHTEAPTRRGQTPGYEGVLTECSRCHGVDGMGRSPLTPPIAGQSEMYLLETLRAYADGRRPSGIMQLSVQAVDRLHLPALARHFSALPRKTRVSDQNDGAMRGEEIARRGRPTDNVPACSGCHEGSARNPVYPDIEGQSALYIATQLRLFREGQRGGTRFSPIMQSAARRLSDEDIADVAAYFSQLASKGLRP